MNIKELMRELWNKSEKAEELGDVRSAQLLEAAGNLVEATFTTGEVEEAMINAICDSLSDAK